jgi:hypothetical protein
MPLRIPRQREPLVTFRHRDLRQHSEKHLRRVLPIPALETASGVAVFGVKPDIEIPWVGDDSAVATKALLNALNQ